MKTVNQKDRDHGTRFVRLVKQHPCLYNYRCEDYSKREAIEGAWKKIAQELKSDPSKLKEKWRNYRTVFLRRCKAQQRGKPIRSDYYLTKEMSFLLPYIKVSVPIQNTLQCLFEEGTTVRDNSTDLERLVADATKTPEPPKEIYTISLSTGDPDKGAMEFQDNDADDEDQPIAESSYINKTAQQQQNIRTHQEADFIDISHIKPDKSVNPPVTMEGTDPRKLFIYSIIPDIETMTDRQFRKFRKQCLDFIDNCEDD